MIILFFLYYMFGRIFSSLMKTDKAAGIVSRAVLGNRQTEALVSAILFFGFVVNSHQKHRKNLRREGTTEMKLTIEFHLWICTFSLMFEIYFLEFPTEISLVLFQATTFIEIKRPEKSRLRWLPTVLRLHARIGWKLK